MTMSRITTVTTVAAIAAVLAGCSSAPSPRPAGAAEGYPVTVTSCGVDYTYESAPSRVLLGYPGSIATLKALGVADAAIGYTQAASATDAVDEYPGLELTSDDWTPSREFLVGAQPDLFLANDEQQLTGDGAASLDDLASIPADLYVLGSYCVSAPASSTIDGVYTDIENLGLIFGVPDAAATVVDGLEKRVADAADANDAAAPLTVAVVSVFDGKVYALSGANYATVPAALDLTNLFASTANFSEISAEVVLEAAPDVILVTYYGGDSEKAAAVADARERFAASPAATSGLIVALPEDAFSSGGVRIVDVIEQTAAGLFG